MKAALAAVVIAALALACRDEPPRSTPATAPPSAAAPSAAAPGKVALIEPAPGGDVAALIVREHARAKADGAPLVVYAGAPWCEPCVRFHDAAASGALDAAFPSLRVLVFDADRDEAALAAAGYDFAMIPLFVVPRADGRPGPRRLEGGITGEGALAHLTPRLRALLAPR